MSGCVITVVPLNRASLGANALAITNSVGLVPAGGKKCVRAAAPRVTWT